MSWIKNIKLAPKLFSAVALLAAVMVTIAVIAIAGLQAVEEGVQELQKGGNRLTNAGRATANLLAFARNVEFLPMGMKPEQRDTYEKAAADELARLQRRLDNLAKIVVVEEGRRNVLAARAAIERYVPDYRKVQEQARRGDLDGAAQTAFAAAAAIADARNALREIEARNDKMMEQTIQNANDAHDRSHRNIIVASSVGTLAGIGLSLALIMLGVTRPLKRMTSSMLSVAGGNLETAVPALGQKDEIGQLAGALEQFKTNGLENRRLQAEQKEMEAKAAARHAPICSRWPTGSRRRWAESSTPCRLRRPSWKPRPRP